MAGEKFTVTLAANVRDFIANLKKAARSSKSIGMANRGITKSFQQMSSATNVVGKRFFRTTQKMKSGIDSIGKATNGLSRNINKKLNPIIKKTTKETDKGTKSWKSYFKIIGVGVAVIGSLVGAFFGLKKLLDIAEIGAAFQVQARAFNNLVASQGVDAKLLVKQLKKVSKDTLDTMSLITTATRAILLGIPASKLVKLMDVARKAAKAMGTTVAGAFSDIALGIGRQSRLILDNLGIIVRVGVAYDNYARSIGTTAGSLTDFEKRQAFLNEALRVGTENLKNSSKNITDFRDRIDQARAAIKDMGKRIAIAILIPFLALVKVLEERDLIGKIKEFFDVVVPDKLLKGLNAINTMLELTLKLLGKLDETDINKRAEQIEKSNRTRQKKFLDFIIEATGVTDPNQAPLALAQSVNRAIQNTANFISGGLLFPKEKLPTIRGVPTGTQAGIRERDEEIELFNEKNQKKTLTFIESFQKFLKESIKEAKGLADALLGVGGTTPTPLEFALRKVKSLTIAAKDLVTKAGDIQKEFAVGIPLIEKGVFFLSKQLQNAKAIGASESLINSLLFRRRDLRLDLVKLRKDQVVTQEEAFLESKGLKSDRRRIAIAKQNIDELKRLTESKALTLQDPIQLLAARDKLIKPILEVFESLPAKLQADVRKLNLWFAKNVIPPDTFKRGLNKWVDDFNNTKDRITQLGINMANSMSRGFDDFFFNTITGKITNLKEAFASLFQSMLRSLTKFMADKATSEFLGLFLGAKGSKTAIASSSGGLFGLLGRLFKGTGNAPTRGITGPPQKSSGGIFGFLKRIVGFQHGGIVNLAGINSSAMITKQPTLAAISEKGQKEAIVPLSDFADLIRPTTININAIDTKSFAQFMNENKEIVFGAINSIKGSGRVTNLNIFNKGPF